MSDLRLLEARKRQQRSIAAHVRAFDSFRASLLAFRKIIDSEAVSDEALRQALLTSGVVHYGRPFSANRASGGGKRVYPVRNVSSAEGFSREVHGHLLALRDRLVAHADEEFTKAEMFLQRMRLKTNLGSFEIASGAWLVVKSIDHLRNKDWAARCAEHVAACTDKAEALAREELLARVSAEQASPSSQQDDLGPATKKSSYSFTGTELKEGVTLQLKESIGVEGPAISHSDAYDYRLTRISVSMSFDLSFEQDGVEIARLALKREP